MSEMSPEWVQEPLFTDQELADAVANAAVHESRCPYCTEDWPAEPILPEPVVFTAKGPMPMKEAAEMLREQACTDIQEEADARRVLNLEKLARLLLNPNAPWGEILYLRKQLGL